MTRSTATSDESRSQTQPPRSKALTTSSETISVSDGRRSRGVEANRGTRGSALGQLGIKPFFARGSCSPSLSAARLNGQIFAEAADVASSEDQAAVVGTKAQLQLRQRVAEIRQPKHLLAAASIGHRGGDQPSVDAREIDLLLASPIDVEHADNVGGGKRTAEFRSQPFGARVKVRLEDGDDSLRAERPRGRNRCGNLSWVVGVIIDD